MDELREEESLSAVLLSSVLPAITHFILISTTNITMNSQRLRKHAQDAHLPAQLFCVYIFQFSVFKGSRVFKQMGL